MRGEHQMIVDEVLEELGSSPHARGAPCQDISGKISQRIIPACAGSTSFGCRSNLVPPDHPRMRGEHFQLTMRNLNVGGSSPHARGAPELPEPVGHRHRIIPACAGSTYAHLKKFQTFPDHPRMRGEHHVDYSSPSASAGSSPHARGARALIFEKVFNNRIIPACAGSTRPPGITPGGLSDHPRMRGEHFGSVRRSKSICGSSPHARGAHRSNDGVKRQCRIIPACAGSTVFPSTQREGS